MPIVNARTLHNRAMGWVDEALIHKRNDDLTELTKAFAEAYRLECEALALTTTEPGLTILRDSTNALREDVRKAIAEQRRWLDDLESKLD